MQGIKSEMLLAMALVEQAYLEVTGVEPTMTSGLDSHKTGKHPVGLAGDFRIKDIPPNKWIRLTEAIRRKLAIAAHEDFISLYDVVLETHLKGNEHIHVEYDPKPKHPH